MTESFWKFSHLSQKPNSQSGREMKRQWCAGNMVSYAILHRYTSHQTIAVKRENQMDTFFLFKYSLSQLRLPYTHLGVSLSLTT